MGDRVRAPLIVHQKIRRARGGSMQRRNTTRRRSPDRVRVPLIVHQKIRRARGGSMQRRNTTRRRKKGARRRKKKKEGRNKRVTRALLVAGRALQGPGRVLRVLQRKTVARRATGA